MSSIEQQFSVSLFVLLYSVVLTFVSVDETLQCDHSNESYCAVLSCGTVCSIVVLFALLISTVLTFDSANETLKSDHSNTTTE